MRIIKEKMNMRSLTDFKKIEEGEIIRNNAKTGKNKILNENK